MADGAVVAMTFAIGRHRIGDPKHCFVIAEAGVNHNGEVALAEQLIDAAATAGADAIKFQTFDPAQLASPSASTAAYQQRAEAGDRQLAMLQKLVLPREAYTSLRKRATDKGLVFLSTPFDNSSADFLFGLGVPAFKVSSGDLTNTLLLRHLARKGLPLILSSGMADLAEVRGAVDAIRDVAPGIDLAVLHCVSNYPAAIEDANLLTIRSLQAALQVPIGFSDHTVAEFAAVAAVALGAAIVEKHLTLDRAMIGPDHQASLDPKAFTAFVSAVRQASSALGDGRKVPVKSEHDIAKIGRRSLYWASALKRGTVVSESDFVALRPGTGLAPDRWRDLVGRALKREVSAHDPVTTDDVE